MAWARSATATPICTRTTRWRSWSACAISATSGPTRPRPRLGVPAFYDAQTMLDALQARPVQRHHRRLRVRQRSLRCPPCRRSRPAATCWARSRSATRSPRPRRWWPRRAKRASATAINLNHRFTPAARLAKRWQNEGRLGHLLFVNMSMWIKNPAESSPYFQIKALHPHTVDIMRYFCGDVEAVQCFATNAPGRTIWTTAHFNMRFKNGVVGGLTGSLRHRARPPDGALRGGRDRRALRDRGHVPRGDPLPGRQPGEDASTPTRSLAGSAISRIPSRTASTASWSRSATAWPPDEIDGSGADGLAAQKVLQAAIESLETGSVGMRSNLKERACMKLGANSVLFGGYDMETAFEQLAMAGYDGIELSAIDGMSEHLVLDRWREIAPRDQAAGAGLSTWSCWRWSSPRRTRPRWSWLSRPRQRAGIPIINCGPGGKTGDEASLQQSIDSIGQAGAHGRTLRRDSVRQGPRRRSDLQHAHHAAADGSGHLPGLWHRHGPFAHLPRRGEPGRGAPGGHCAGKTRPHPRLQGPPAGTRQTGRYRPTGAAISTCWAISACCTRPGTPARSIWR